MNEDKDIKMPNFMVDLAFKDYIKALSDTQAGKLFKILIDYADGENIDESKLSPSARITFDALKSTVNKGKEKYVKKVLHNREIAKNRKKKTSGDQTQPVVTSGDQRSTKSDQIKLNKSKLISKDINLRLSASSACSPDGRPAPKPEYCELRKFFKEQFNYDDAYFCDEFLNAMEEKQEDWQNWQDKMINYAVKVGKASYE